MKSINQRTLIFSLLLLVSSVLTFAFATTPETDDNDSRSQWLQEYRRYKQEFLSKEMDLTTEQEQQFFPLYDEMEQSMLKINAEAKDVEQKLSATPPDECTEQDYLDVATEMAQIKTKEAELEIIYFDKFKSILTPKQLFELKRAENRFSRHLLRQHKQKSNRRQ